VKAVRWHWYIDLIIFIWENATLQRWVDPKYAVKKLLIRLRWQILMEIKKPPRYNKQLVMINCLAVSGLENLIMPQLLKKFAIFCGPQRLITMLTRNYFKPTESVLGREMPGL
jgi:hypothetical protein